jgi:hypothetical protein
VAQALGLDVSISGAPLAPHSGLYVADAPEATSFRAGPRVGVDYAAEAHRRAPWRLALPDTRWVSVPKELHPWRGTAQDFLRAEARDAETCAAAATPATQRAARPETGAQRASAVRAPLTKTRPSRP